MLGCSILSAHLWQSLLISPLTYLTYIKIIMQSVIGDIKCVDNVRTPHLDVDIYIYIFLSS